MAQGRLAASGRARGSGGMRPHRSAGAALPAGRRKRRACRSIRALEAGSGQSPVALVAESPSLPYYRYYPRARLGVLGLIMAFKGPLLTGGP
jgi:hypothetical protein